MRGIKEIVNKLEGLVSRIENVAGKGNEGSSTVLKLWELNEKTNNIFSELDLLLSINPSEENRKMKKGLTKVGKDLIQKGKELIKYGTDSEIETIN